LLQYIVRRVLWALLTIVLVVAATFWIFFVIGGGRRIEGQEVSPTAVLLAGRRAVDFDYVRQLDRELGLGKPLHEQFLTYTGNLARGDFGYDFQSGEPIRNVVFASVLPTLGLVLGASILWLVGAVVAGAVAARRHRSLTDRGFTALALVLLSLPVFWVGLVTYRYFVVEGLYEIDAYVGITEDPKGWLATMWLPCAVLALSFVGPYFRMVRGNMLGVQQEDYMRTAAAKGLTERGIIRHQLRSSVTPVLTLYGVDFGVLMGGVIIVETIFHVPGLGSLAVDAATNLDFPFMVGAVVVASAFVILASLLVDVVYAFLDPRVVYS